MTVRPVAGGLHIEAAQLMRLMDQGKRPIAVGLALLVSCGTSPVTRLRPTEPPGRLAEQDAATPLVAADNPASPDIRQAAVPGTAGHSQAVEAAVGAPPRVAAASAPENAATRIETMIHVSNRTDSEWPSTPRDHAWDLSMQYGPSWQRGWEALEQLVENESEWNPRARNPRSGACGLFQRHPCQGQDTWHPREQAKDGLKYIGARYDHDPRKALRHQKRRGWF